MNEPADFVANETAGESRADVVAPAGPCRSAQCPRCQADLSRVHRSAHFCPRCGGSLDANSTMVAPTPSCTKAADSADSVAVNYNLRSVATAWRQLRGAHASLPHVRGFPSDGSVAADSHSLMLLGYANAMYRLGWRYETGLGMGRNTEEALRCYFKAAKLGNSAALARLAPRCVAGDQVVNPSRCD